MINQFETPLSNLIGDDEWVGFVNRSRNYMKDLQAECLVILWLIMSNIEKKSQGKYFTPPTLAKFLADISINDSNVTIFDPSYGNGALLLAAHKELKGKGSINPAEKLFGVDIYPPCKEFQDQFFHGILNKKHLFDEDFFTFPENAKRKYSLILMNPPFIRHHDIDSEQYEKIRSALGEKLIVPKSSDMWAYFLIHSQNFLKKGGSLAAILPWSFIQAEYAKKMREYLLDKFESIETLVLGEHFFENAQERVLIIHAKKFGFSTDHISIGYSHDIPKKNMSLINIDRKDWLNSPWKVLVSKKNAYYLKKIEENIPFKPLGEFANVKIGTVTGSNSFFILDSKSIIDYQIPDTLVKPIVTNSKELRTLSIKKIDNWKKYLLLIPKSTDIKGHLSNYIEKGEKLGYPKMYHNKNREIWYSLSMPREADGFLQYMSKEIPYIVFNKSRVFSTNAVHQIFFNDKIDENTRKWIEFSMFSFNLAIIH